MKNISIIKNNYFNVNAVITGERGLYCKNTYAFVESNHDEKNIISVHDIGEIVLNYDKETNIIKIDFLKYEFFKDSYEILKYNVINTIEIPFTDAKKLNETLKTMDIDINLWKNNE